MSYPYDYYRNMNQFAVLLKQLATVRLKKVQLQEQLRDIKRHHAKLQHVFDKMEEDQLIHSLPDSVEKVEEPPRRDHTTVNSHIFSKPLYRGFYHGRKSKNPHRTKRTTCKKRL